MHVFKIISNQYIFQKPNDHSILTFNHLYHFFQPHQATPLNYPLRPLFSVLASTPWERLGTGQCTSWTWPWGHSTACGRTWWCIMRCLLPGGVGFLRTFCFFLERRRLFDMRTKPDKNLYCKTSCSYNECMYFQAHLVFTSNIGLWNLGEGQTNKLVFPWGKPWGCFPFTKPGHGIIFAPR